MSLISAIKRKKSLINSQIVFTEGGIKFRLLFFIKEIMKHLLYSIALAIILSGCTSNPADDREALLKIVIVKYNNAVIEAYKNQNFEYLKQVATEKEIDKIGIMISSFRQTDQIMKAEFHKIDFREIKIQGDKTDVRTSEDWSYRWIDYKTGQEVEPLKNIHYEILYHLIKKDGKWLVEKVEDMKK